MSPAEVAAWNHAAGFRHYRKRAATHPMSLMDLAVLRKQTDELMRTVALSAREAGYSWAEVGEALGISRQAAQQRYGTVTE